jgi:LEA14-like dessication related protein
MSSVRLLAILLALVFTASCASLGTGLEPPEVSLVNLKPLAGTGFEQQFEITLRVLNPNSVPLEGDGIDLQLDVNGRRLARALSSERFVIPRLGDATVTLVATTNVIDVFRQVVVLPNAGGRFDYLLSGRVLLDGSAGWLNFTREGSLTPESAAAQ